MFMQTVYYIVTNNGDGSNSVEWYKDIYFTKEQLVEAAELDKYDSYASGDGVQITTLQFPDNFDLNTIQGINWKTTLPGVYEVYTYDD